VWLWWSIDVWPVEVRRTKGDAVMRYPIILAGLLLACNAVAVSAQSLYANAEQAPSLFQDRKPTRANMVGDILTVLITENTSASNTSNLETSKENSVNINNQKGTGPLSFIPGFGLISGNTTDFTGNGSTSRQQQIQARVSVTVVGVKVNGDLIIQGSRTIEINGEREVIFVSGAVNPLIIPADNTIESFRISNLQVSYKGKGAVSTGSRPGVFTRLINWVF
jgi:flagellar L-ring protein precursor FlgH